MSQTIKYILLFILLWVFQVAILNNVITVSRITIYLYILFIIYLPFTFPKWALTLLAFFLGLSIDTASNTGGIHSAASTLIGYLRPYIIGVFKDRFEMEYYQVPSINSMGRNIFVNYITIVFFIHNFACMYLEVFTFKNFFVNFIFVLINTVIAVLLSLLFEYLFRKQVK